MALVEIEITQPPPVSAEAGNSYDIKGSAKFLDAIGSPPFVYAICRRKEWYKPEALEETSFEKSLPAPITGNFTIKFKPKKDGDYKITVVATPAPISIPVVGVFPTTGETEEMKVEVGKETASLFRFSSILIDGHTVDLSDHDADSNLLLEKTTSDKITVRAYYEWQGPAKTAQISIKAGHKDWLGGFSPKTNAYTAMVDLPESTGTITTGLTPIVEIPLTQCGGLDDGAIEVVLKVSDMADYISRIWDVYTTEGAPPADYLVLGTPTTNKYSYQDGETVTITVPVINQSDMALTGNVEITVMQGAAIGSGDILATLNKSVSVGAHSSVNVAFTYIAVDIGGDATRDVDFDLTVGGQQVDHLEKDDLFRVEGGTTPPEYHFGISDAINVEPQSAPVGPVTISTVITENINSPAVTATVRCSVYDGTGGENNQLGNLLWSTTKQVSFQPDVPKTVSFTYQSTEEEDEKRDVKIEVLVDGQVIVQKAWLWCFMVLRDTVNISVSIINADQLLPGANRWMVDYYDPVLGQLVLDSGWHNLSETVYINNIHSPVEGPWGYFVVTVYIYGTGVRESLTSPPVYSYEGMHWVGDMATNNWVGS